jgi:hypothetical protein
MKSAFEEAVQQAVEEGVITQSQADRILENQNEFGLRIMKGPGLWGGHGFGRRFDPEGLFPLLPDSMTPDITPPPDDQ